MAVDTQELEAQRPPGAESVPPAVLDVEQEGPPPRPPTARLAIVAACPVLAAAIMTGGLFLGAGGRVWASITGLLGILLAIRARDVPRQSLLYVTIVAGVIVIGLIAVVQTGFSNVLDLATQIRSAITTSEVLRPPVDFAPGWHAILGWIMASIGFTAAWVAIEVRRPALGVLVALPVIGLGSISLPDDQKLATGLTALVLFVVALGVLSGTQVRDDEQAIGLGFELRRAARALPLIAIVTVLLYFAARSSFLFPDPLYDPAQEAKLPKTIPLSEVQDRVLFTVDAKFNGPWKMGSLDVYEARDGSWRLPPFAQSSLHEVPESGIVNKELPPGVRATFTVRGLGGAILPGLPNTVGIVAVGPTLSYDGRVGNIRVTQGQIKAGFQYIVAAASTPTINRLRHADTSVPRRYRPFLDIPDQPPAVAALLEVAPKRGWDRVDFLRQKLLHTVSASGAGTPVSVPPSKVQDMLAGSKQGTPFEIVAAQAMLARWAGVPSRIGYGFDGGDPGPGGVLEVRPKHGALFLEIFFEDFGWLPVIGDPLQAKESLSSNPQQFNPQVQISKDIGVQLFLPILTEQRPTFFEEFRRFAFRLGPILLALLLVYYLWPLPYKAYRRARRRSWAAEEGTTARVALAYADWRDHATDFGYHHETDTPLMFLNHVVPDDEHAELAWLVTRALWGDMRGTLTADDALAAEEISRSLRRRLAQAHPATIRFVAALSRLSVRHPYAPGIDHASRREGEREKEYSVA